MSTPHVTKRRRVMDDSQSNETAAVPVPCEPVNIVRDSHYYMEDGDCIIRVQNTLFKIHRFVLSRDSSAFRAMFRVPQATPKARAEGSSDDKPIILSGDSAQTFKALLRILYALPTDFQQYHTLSLDNFECLLSIAEITNKYHFVSTELWVIDLIFKAVQNPENCLYKVSPDLALRTLSMAVLQNNTKLRDAVVDILVTRVLNGDVPPLPALTLACEHSIRSLQGAAYYAQLLKMDRSTIGQNRYLRPMPLVEDKEWSKDQHIRLLFGYWSLKHTHDYLSEHPFWHKTELRIPSCCQGGCKYWITSWQGVWKRDSDPKSTDLLKKLKNAEKFLKDITRRSPMPHGNCEASGFSSLAAGIKALQDNLMDHFIDFTSPLFLNGITDLDANPNHPDSDSDSQSSIVLF